MKYIIDENGFLLYASLLPTTKTHTEIKYEDTFLKPKLVNNKWIEEATNEELLEIKSKLICQHL